MDTITRGNVFIESEYQRLETVGDFPSGFREIVNTDRCTRESAIGTPHNRFYFPQWSFDVYVAGGSTV